MARIKKLKENGSTIYPATIPQAVVDPETNENIENKFSKNGLQLSFIFSQLTTPIPIAAWTAMGKKNNDVDKSTLYDITGNGHDIKLHGFDFSTNGSGYENDGYENALIFDGIDDYGICNNLPLLPNGYTFIIKRKRLIEKDENAIFLKGTNPNSSILTFENKALNGRIYEVSYGSDNDGKIKNFSQNDIVYRTDTSYDGISLSKGNYVENETNRSAFLGSLNGYRFSNFAFYSAYLFDRTLTEKEIECFIRNNIDSNYKLPVRDVPEKTNIYDETYKYPGVYVAPISSIYINGTDTPLYGNSTIITIGNNAQAGYIEQVIITSIDDKAKMFYRSWDLTTEPFDFVPLLPDVATQYTAGLVKSGGDITVSDNGEVTVNNSSSSKHANAISFNNSSDAINIDNYPQDDYGTIIIWYNDAQADRSFSPGQEGVIYQTKYKSQGGETDAPYHDCLTQLYVGSGGIKHRTAIDYDIANPFDGIAWS